MTKPALCTYCYTSALKRIARTGPAYASTYTGSCDLCGGYYQLQHESAATVHDSVSYSIMAHPNKVHPEVAAAYRLGGTLAAQAVYDELWDGVVLGPGLSHRPDG